MSIYLVGLCRGLAARLLTMQSRMATSKRDIVKIVGIFEEDAAGTELLLYCLISFHGREIVKKLVERDAIFQMIEQAR